ncbi:hypothetical protein HK098_004822 [Nowakowskiella sp. JEL0407]|nr:hypothetical protein HK098_004822 [Nowakowskiella sp. JEL0407]
MDGMIAEGLHALLSFRLIFYNGFFRFYSVFGFFNVSTPTYPWILLFIIQLFFPGASFVSHFSGIVTAYLYLYGLFTFILPSSTTISKIESFSFFKSVTLMESYVPASDTAVLPQFTISNSNGEASTYDVLSLFSRSSALSESANNDPRFPGTGRVLSETPKLKTLSTSKNIYQPVSSNDNTETENFGSKKTKGQELAPTKPSEYLPLFFRPTKLKFTRQRLQQYLQHRSRSSKQIAENAHHLYENSEIIQEEEEKLIHEDKDSILFGESENEIGYRTKYGFVMISKRVVNEAVVDV